MNRRELMDRVWPDVTVDESNLRAHITGLRKALGDGQNDARYIANVPGRGYCFIAPVHIVDVSATASSPPNDAHPQLPAKLARIVGRDDAIAACRTHGSPCLRSRKRTSAASHGMGQDQPSPAATYACDDLSGAGVLRETAANSLPIGFRPSVHQCEVRAQVIACLALGALVVALFTAAGSAQTGHGKYHDDFYSRWLTKQGYSCCSNKDCRPISTNNVRVLSDKMKVLLDGEWVDVRPDAIRPYAAPDMSSHICALGKYIVCFVYGSGV